MPQKIAIIGAGIMGSAIATRLLQCGHAVFVFDLDAQKVAALDSKGASDSAGAMRLLDGKQRRTD